MRWGGAGTSGSAALPTHLLVPHLGPALALDGALHAVAALGGGVRPRLGGRHALAAAEGAVDDAAAAAVAVVALELVGPQGRVAARRARDGALGAHGRLVRLAAAARDVLPAPELAPDRRHGADGGAVLGHVVQGEVGAALLAVDAARSARVGLVVEPVALEHRLAAPEPAQHIPHRAPVRAVGVLGRRRQRLPAPEPALHEPQLAPAVQVGGHRTGRDPPALVRRRLELDVPRGRRKG